MQIEVVPLMDFQHGGRAFARDRVALVPESTAVALERAKLVRVKMQPSPRTQEAPALRNQMEPNPPGKAPADGAGTPSASSQVAQASQPTTSQPPKRGRGRPRTKGI